MAFGVPLDCVVGTDLDCTAFGFAGDTDRQGVAISRLSQHMAMVCNRIIDPGNPLKPLLDHGKFLNVEDEAKKMLVHFKARCAHAVCFTGIAFVRC